MYCLPVKKKKKKKILPRNRFLPQCLLFFSSCENVFLSREWRCISAQKGKHVCYCTKTNRINLTSRGSGAETSLTTAAGPSDCCTLPNQAALWKRCHFIPGTKKKKRRGVRVGAGFQVASLTTGIRKEGKISLFHFFFLLVLFWISAFQVEQQRKYSRADCVGSRGSDVFQNNELDTLLWAFKPPLNDPRRALD